MTITDFQNNLENLLKNKGKLSIAETIKLQQNLEEFIGSNKEEPQKNTDIEELKTLVMRLFQEFSTLKTSLGLTYSTSPSSFKEGLKGKDGVDAIVNYPSIVKNVLSKIPKPKDGKDGKNAKDGKDGKNGKDGLPEKPNKIARGLENLQDEEKLDFFALKNRPDVNQLIATMRQNLGSKGGGGQGPKVIDSEVPTGIVNGVNTDFTLEFTPNPGTLKVYMNGARLKLTEDYTLLGKIVTFLVVPPTGSIILFDYKTND